MLVLFIAVVIVSIIINHAERNVRIDFEEVFPLHVKNSIIIAIIVMHIDCLSFVLTQSPPKLIVQIRLLLPLLISPWISQLHYPLTFKFENTQLRNT